MPLINMADLRAALPRHHRLIGLDPGSRIIGVALSDVTLRLASPYGTIRRGKVAPIASAILAIVRKEGVGGLVVGYPLSMDGTVGPAAQAARDWAHAISAATSLPAALWDERLSTVAAHETLLEADLSRARRAQLVDAMAAAYTLQAALDATARAP